MASCKDGGRPDKHSLVSHTSSNSEQKRKKSKRNVTLFSKQHVSTVWRLSFWYHPFLIELVNTQKPQFGVIMLCISFEDAKLAVHSSS